MVHPASAQEAVGGAVLWVSAASPHLGAETTLWLWGPTRQGQHRAAWVPPWVPLWIMAPCSSLSGCGTHTQLLGTHIHVPFSMKPSNSGSG